MKTTTHTLRKLKGQRPIAAVTAYDAITARLADAAEADLILVGDSVGNTLLGFENTVPVTIEMMVHHTAAVARAKPAALLVADVPFAEAHFDFERVLRACQRLMQEAGAEAVKIEAGAALAPQIARLSEAGVPVWGHLGLKPQQVQALGRYKKFGVDAREAERLLADALALERAGAFALLLELIEPNLARTITETVKIPTIGIGAGPYCDGQILVCTDLLGLTQGGTPGFARAFSHAGEEIKKGFAAYVAAVRAREFPK
ncbi:MAG: 3-methyl-2-oxobutanoate hydroxymethyltransferase [Verrucomicrobiota bacterium]|nr:3-methyl-2-oxobutanoate hydroxymethyltransferase [Verrucomicrobiota bacterium]